MLASRDPSERLRRAVQEDSLPLVRRLSQKYDLRNTDRNMHTSLSWAAICGNEDMFEWILIDGGHDDDELSRDSENNTILHLLASLPSKTLTPAHRVARFASGCAIRMAGVYYDRFSFVLDWANTGGKTAMHVAAQEGNLAFVRLLMDLGADFDLPDVFGNTPLHYASAWGHLSIVQLLITSGCQFAARNNEGYTANDFAYSTSLQGALQDLARAQFDAKRNKRHNGAQVPGAQTPNYHSGESDSYRGDSGRGSDSARGESTAGEKETQSVQSASGTINPSAVLEPAYTPSTPTQPYGTPMTGHSSPAFASPSSHGSAQSSQPVYLHPPLPPSMPSSPLVPPALQREPSNLSVFSNNTTTSSSSRPSSPHHSSTSSTRQQRPPLPPMPPPSSTVPLRNRSTSTSTYATQSTSGASSRSKGSAGSEKPSVDGGQSTTSSRHGWGRIKKDKEGKEKTSKWSAVGLGGGGKHGGLIPPPNSTKGLWGSKG